MMKSNRNNIWKNAKRIVIKIGASMLCDDSGRFSKERVKKIAQQVIDLLKTGKKCILVSSGAIACGMDMMRLRKRPKDLPLLQACAAIGQGKLMKYYEEVLIARKLHTAQILLTPDILHDRIRYLNTRNTFHALLEVGALPIVNENDTVVTDEIRFGDNDRLSAIVSQITAADLLINLSNVPGVLDESGHSVTVVRSQEELENLKRVVFESKAEKTVGGMKSKLDAARILMSSGIPMMIADGRDFSILKKIFKGDACGTLFVPFRKKQNCTRTWLAHCASPKGKVRIDAGAFEAILKQGKSLLSSGITEVEGHFKSGDAVRILTPKGDEFGRGLTNYSGEELMRIYGKRSSEIEKILGYKFYDEVIHRDNLVILHGGA